MFRVIHKASPYAYTMVYATRTNEDGETEFLTFFYDDWKWVLASNYKPMPL